MTNPDVSMLKEAIQLKNEQIGIMDQKSKEDGKILRKEHMMRTREEKKVSKLEQDFNDKHQKLEETINEYEKCQIKLENTENSNKLIVEEILKLQIELVEIDVGVPELKSKVGETEINLENDRLQLRELEEKQMNLELEKNSLNSEIKLKKSLIEELTAIKISRESEIIQQNKEL